MKLLIKKICVLIYWLIGWKAVGLSVNHPEKFMLIIAPHTSNWDFMVGLFARYILGYGYNTKFLGKSSLFESPFGFFFYWIGGIPVYRNQKNNMVEQVVSKYAEAKGEFGIIISPEGTRKYVKEWKTGFYHIALKANVPIIPIGLDYGKKQVIATGVFYLTGNQEEDLQKLKALFKDMKAYNPVSYNDVP